MIEMAYKKTSHPFGVAFVRAVLANWLVCLVRAPRARALRELCARCSPPHPAAECHVPGSLLAEGMVHCATALSMYWAKPRQPSASGCTHPAMLQAVWQSTLARDLAGKFIGIFLPVAGEHPGCHHLRNGSCPPVVLCAV